MTDPHIDLLLKAKLKPQDDPVPAAVHLRISETLLALPPAATVKARRQRRLYVTAGISAVLALSAAFMSVWYPGPVPPAAPAEQFSASIQQTIIDQAIPITLERIGYDGNELQVRFTHAASIDLGPVPARAHVNGNYKLQGETSKEVSGDGLASTQYTLPLHLAPEEQIEVLFVLDEVTLIGGDGSITSVQGNWRFKAGASQVELGYASLNTHRDS